MHLNNNSPDIDECVSIPCQNGGTCVNEQVPDLYTCQCVAGYEGVNCAAGKCILLIECFWNYTAMLTNAKSNHFMKNTVIALTFKGLTST